MINEFISQLSILCVFIFICVSVLSCLEVNCLFNLKHWGWFQEENYIKLVLYDKKLVLNNFHGIYLLYIKLKNKKDDNNNTDLNYWDIYGTPAVFILHIWIL